MTTLNPGKDWNWDKETQSRILAKLDQISCILANMFRKEGSPKAKPDKQWQPDYVAEAKKKALAQSEEDKRLTQEQIETLKQFWKQRNPEAHFVEE